MKARANQQVGYIHLQSVSTMEPSHFFETKRTIVRRLNSPDKPGFIELMTDRRVFDNLSFNEASKTRAGAIGLFDTIISSYDSEFPILTGAIYNKKSHVFLGVVGLNNIDQTTAEIYYALLPRYWRQGLSTEVIQRFLNYIFQNTHYKFLKLHITHNNQALLQLR